MDVFASIDYSLYKFRAQIFFLFLNKEKISLNNKYAHDYNKLGYAAFSNREIQKNCKKIIERIKEEDTLFDEKNRLINPGSVEFRDEFIEIFKHGVDAFIKASFKSDYKIFSHVLFKSKRYSKAEIAEGSALWHADGGPGICMNLMFCHSPVNNTNGALKVIPWQYSKNILSRTFYSYKKWTRKVSNLYLSQLNRMEKREVRCNSLKQIIDAEKIKYFQPDFEKSGLIYAFKNNCVHAGGFPEMNQERVVSVMHIYPSVKKTSILEKFSKDHLKRSPYPLKMQLD